ncbi:MAG TPA: sialate O-acetylesterase [Acidobacteriaceae bacterium]|nr:sialate O-acetylesterase [Acidobacteriaceae bacterium]
MSRRILLLLVAVGFGPVSNYRCGAQPPFFAGDSKTPAVLPFVSPLFGDNTVLQRNKVDKIWGWSEPGDTIRVEVGKSTGTSTAGPDRRWEVEIQPPPAGGPYTLKVTGSHQNAEIHNVLVGDVWICGGQSNMEFRLRGAKDSDQEIKAANFPQIRFFTLAQHPAYHHTDNVKGRWNPVTPETAAQVSAVAYYFAKRVQQDTHIPIGLVIDCVGGTPAETWMSVASLRQLGGWDVPLAELARVSATGGQEYGNYVMPWYDEYDIGMKEHWSDPALDDSNWKNVDLFSAFKTLNVPDTPSLVWFRKELVLPDPPPAGRATLYLGSVERMDTVYINGRFMGGSAWVENPRVYRIPDGLLRPGKNTLAIRVLKSQPDGGFLDKPEVVHLAIGDTNIPLAQDWKAKLSVDARPPHPLPISYENWPVMPSVLYQGMLEPVAPLSITGAIWYQGEANTKRGFEYRKVMPAMIADWRKLFGQGNFPFYIVGLPFYGHHSATPVDGDQWAETRESQEITVATVPNTCLAVTIDTGDPDSVHPTDKEPVGNRLAYCALALNYGEKVPYQGPTFTAAEPLPAAIRLHFAHAEGGLVVKGSRPEEFEIAGDDHIWHWAEARLSGDTVIVSSSEVQNPKAVRYAWQSNPAATLYNKAGLPAVPFRTDTWPVSTETARPY